MTLLWAVFLSHMGTCPPELACHGRASVMGVRGRHAEPEPVAAAGVA
jgi:hypothetical protein